MINICVFVGIYYEKEAKNNKIKVNSNKKILIVGMN